jgi:peptide/nickel transport system substrate-binding protein
LASLALTLTACMAELPASVIEGSSVTVGWAHSLTSFNAASKTGDTEGNREIASVTHDNFARLAGGEVVVDETFGMVEVVDSDPTSFTVRYDLAERTWSDGIPIDAADLLLAWAAGSNATAGEFASISSDLRHSADVPAVDDFERRIDVAYNRPVRNWQTALDVAVPAHVVGELSLGVEDPMEAKQAVVDAITDGDEGDLADLAEAWNSGFDLRDADTALPDALTVGSGPYLVTAVDGTGTAADVRLEVNRSYEGDTPPSYERIEVVAGDDPLEGFPDDLDVVQVDPTPDNFVTVRDLERRDHHVSETHSGQLWTLVLRADSGVFRSLEARRAFLRATSPADLRSAGAGAWEGAYAASQSLLFAPESDGYTISLEDAGFRAAFESAATDAQVERARAGVAAGTQVCVLYDTDDPFAAGAFRGLETSVAEAGWAARDCGEAEIDSSLGRGGGWQAVLTRVPLPETPGDISAIWGAKKNSPLTGIRSKERRRLVAQLDKTADVYDAREIQVAIEAGLFEEYVALPLALDPVVTLSERSMNAVLPDSGDDVTLLGGAGIWEPES